MGDSPFCPSHSDLKSTFSFLIYYFYGSISYPFFIFIFSFLSLVLSFFPLPSAVLCLFFPPDSNIFFSSWVEDQSNSNQ